MHDHDANSPATMATKPVPERRLSNADRMKAFDIELEVLFEIEAIAEQLLRADSLDRYQLRTFGARLRELCTIGHYAIDNANEEQMTWVELRALLTGIDEEATHV